MWFLLFVHYAASVITLLCGASMSFASTSHSDDLVNFLFALGASAAQCVAVFAIFTLEYRRCQCGWVRSLLSAFVLTAALAGSAWVGLYNLSIWISENRMVDADEFVTALVGVIFITFFVKLPRLLPKVFVSIPFTAAAFVTMVTTVGPYALEW